MLSAGHFEIHPNLALTPDYDWLSADDLEPWVWRPSAALLSELPTGWGLVLGCAKRPDGDRVFYPVSPPAEQEQPRGKQATHVGRDFLARTFSGGLALLNVTGQVSAAQVQHYSEMWLFHQRARRTHDYVKRDFAGPRDVKLTPGGVDNALIDELDKFLERSGGLRSVNTIISGAFRVPGSEAAGGADRKGVRDERSPVAGNFTLPELGEIGQKAAEADGVPHPTNKQRIQYGLIEVARKATHLTVPKPEELVLRALFAPGVTQEHVEHCLDHPLTERIRRAFWAHRNDDIPSFNKWCWGGSNSLVSQLAKPHTEYERSEVQQLLAALGARALPYIGRAVHTQMYVLIKAISPPLNPLELAVYEHMYLRQQYLADLPAVLLLDRWPFLLPALKKIWEQPNVPAHIAALHRAMHLFAELVEARRKSDLHREGLHRRRTKALPDDLADPDPDRTDPHADD